MKLVLEESVAGLLEACGKKGGAKTRLGRIDIAVYYPTKPQPRQLIEVKKITTSKSLNKDFDRVLDLMKRCEKIQNGVLVGYGTRAKAGSLEKLFEGTEKELFAKLEKKALEKKAYVGWRVERIRGKGIGGVKSKKGEVRDLYAVVYKVSPPKTSNRE